MSQRISGYLAGAAFALYAAAGAAAFAQPAPPPAPEHADRQMRSERRVMIMRDGEGNMTFERGMHDEKGQADHLRAILQLKPAQEAALTAYLAAMKPPERDTRTVRLDRPTAGGPDRPAGAAGERRGPVMMRPAEPKTTPERLALMEKRLADHEALVRARLTATRKFYDQLDPAQKRAYDELPPMMIDGPMGMGGRHMGPPMKIMMRGERPHVEFPADRFAPSEPPRPPRS